jgi:hypothetical protein
MVLMGDRFHRSGTGIIIISIAPPARKVLAAGGPPGRLYGTVAAICAFRFFAGAQSTLVVPLLTNGRASGYNHQEGDTV